MDRRELTKDERILNLLGLARRAGVLAVGQDKVFSALKEETKYLVLTTSDISDNVMRHVRNAIERGTARHISLDALDRAGLGAQIGVSSAQVIALPSDNGLAIKILKIYENEE
ncbi:hypothetical protein LJC40_06685 [Synergistaceae bacterium OttesenSCG-928-D05]|nr:hypothetical protein [Synergistaceae bacterium OttesenSCG-928-D05]